MHFFRILLVLVAGAIVAGATAQADSGNTQGITDTTIKIGSLGPFSGESSVFDPLNYGPDAYLRYINAQGGVHGRKFVTVFADGSCNEAKGIAAAKKLIYEDKVFMIMGSPCSGVSMAIKPMLVKEGVPWIGISANPKLTTPVVPGMFHTTYTGVQSGHAMASFALSKPGVTKIALVEHSNDWAHGYCDPATDYIKQHGGTIVATTVMERGSTDATTQALQIKASGAQGVMGCLYQQELVIFLRAMQTYRVDAFTVGALGADFEQTVRDVGDPAAVRGKFFQPYQFKAKLGEGPLKKFHDIFVKYLTRSELPKQGEPTNFYYFGVPAAIVTVEAFRLAGPHPTRESWEAAIESLKNFDTGVLADTETFSHDNHVGVERMYAVGLDKNGNEVVYKSWDQPIDGGS
ncbi:MAG TPA: ABC transporter substrate-binding protein [Acetobacteraceae bacterium]|nr:ABC transporter substrate-binding protein [Acetobacteraceae bacterium]